LDGAEMVEQGAIEIEEDGAVGHAKGSSSRPERFPRAGNYPAGSRKKYLVNAGRSSEIGWE
jgi:hypothetical protein